MTLYNKNNKMKKENMNNVIQFETYRKTKTWYEEEDDVNAVGIKTSFFHLDGEDKCYVWIMGISLILQFLFVMFEMFY